MGTLLLDATAVKIMVTGGMPMPRRGENIYKRKDGRWEGRYIADRKPDGGALYRSVYGTTYADVRQKLAVCREENRKQQFRGCNLTVK